MYSERIDELMKCKFDSSKTSVKVQIIENKRRFNVATEHFYTSSVGKKVCKANSVEESVYIFQRFESKCDIPYYNKNYSEMAVGSSCLCRSQPNLYFSTDKLTQNLFITHTHKSTYRVKTVTKYSLETPSFQ